MQAQNKEKDEIIVQLGKQISALNESHSKCSENEIQKFQQEIKRLQTTVITKKKELDEIQELYDDLLSKNALSQSAPENQNVQHQMCFTDSQLRDSSALDTQLSMDVDHIDPNQDIIRCLCGLFRDEFSKVQCLKCMVWQHAGCAGVDENVQKYLCERCDKRTVDLEISLNECSDDGYHYYLTLMRGDLQVRESDTVYILRDISIPHSALTSPIGKHTYKTIGNVEFTECDIFRVERLWKDNEGNRFIYGHHYLRPKETFYEPTRKFYKNEILQVSNYEVLSINLVMGRCWVFNSTTFSKGRPIDCDEVHVYICDWKVDKKARNFSKLKKQQHPVCTKSFAFKMFDEKLKISRTYSVWYICAYILFHLKRQMLQFSSEIIFFRPWITNYYYMLQGKKSITITIYTFFGIFRM